MRDNRAVAACAECGTALPDGARFCHACGATQESAPPAVDERKLATVLFADLVGSTALADGEDDPERTRARLERFYDAMREAVEAAGGTVEKFAGDAVMAVFGVPAAHEDDAERALHAALAMQRRLQELFDRALGLRIGVNTGEVVAGRPREGSSFATGDAVNVTARLEQAAAAGEILVGERTVAAVRGAFELGPSRTVEAKGKEGGVACRPLLRALSLMRPRGLRGAGAAFVGRDNEIELLEATYRRCLDGGVPHLVTIMGDAGAGKSTIVRELWRRLSERDPEPTRRTGRCLPYGHGITYRALGEILREHLGLTEEDDPEAARGRLGGRDILGLALGLAVEEELHPLAARDRLHDAWVGFLQDLAAERPTVVLVEDLHWAEEDLLDLLERVAREAEGPLLLLATARPELLDRRPAWGGGRRNASLVWVEPLASADTARMVDELLAGSVPAEVRARIVERAEGNPLFVEELLAALMDSGALVRDDDGGWRATEAAAGVEVPDTVHAVVAARMDLLPEREKTALQAASVVGRTFWAGAVRELTGADADFALLEERDFVRRRPSSSLPDERELVIRHAIVREVAYASLPKARRARMHAAFADWVERLVGDREDLAALLAHHLAEAVRPEDADLAWAGREEELAALRPRAFEALRRAAAGATSRYEVDDAVTLLERALPLAPADDDRLELLLQLGRVHALRFDGERFGAALQEALELATDLDTQAEIYSRLAFETLMRGAMWRAMPDNAVIEGWARRAQELATGETPARARALVTEAAVRDREDLAAEAEEMARRLDDVRLVVFARAARVFIALHSVALDDAEAHGSELDALAAQITDPDEASEIVQARILTALARGRFDEADRRLGAYDRLLLGLTPHYEVHAVGQRLLGDELRGAWEDVAQRVPAIERAVEANAGTPCILNPRSLLTAAAASAWGGRADESVRLEAAADAIPYTGFDAMLRNGRLQVALARRDLGRIERLLAEESGPDNETPLGGTLVSWRASTLLDGLIALGDRARIEREAPSLLDRPGWVVEPFALRALGWARDDQELLERAAAIFERMGAPWHVRRTRALLGAAPA